MGVQTRDLSVSGELFLADGGPLPLRLGLYRSAENEIALEVGSVNTDNEVDSVVTLYFADAETSRLAHMLGVLVLERGD